MLRYRSDSHPQECNDQGTWIIVPSIHIRPIWWTYANVCIHSRMIRDIRLDLFFPFGFLFYIHYELESQPWGVSYSTVQGTKDPSGTRCFTIKK